MQGGDTFYAWFNRQKIHLSKITSTTSVLPDYTWDVRENDWLEAGLKEYPVMSDFTWGSLLRLCWVVVALLGGWAAGADSISRCVNHTRLDSSDIIIPSLFWLSPLNSFSHLIFSVVPPLKATTTSRFLPMEPLKRQEKRHWLMWLPAARVWFHSTRNRKEKETAATLLNCHHVEQEKHHVESVWILQSHTSRRISLLPCTLQVCYHNPNMWPDSLCAVTVTCWSHFLLWDHVAN